MLVTKKTNWSTRILVDQNFGCHFWFFLQHCIKWLKKNFLALIFGKNNWLLLYIELKRAFWSFHSHYPSLADSLLNSLDAKTQKLLQNGSQGAFGSVKSLKDGFSSLNVNPTNYDTTDSAMVQSSRLQQKPAVTSSSHLAGKPLLFLTLAQKPLNLKLLIQSNLNSPN